MVSKSPALAQQLATQLEQSIAEGRLQPGERIATMEELRRRTGYGRATIGETARLLSERGTVEVRPGRGGGLFVAALNPVVRLRRTLLSVPQGQTTVSDAIAVREALEEIIALDATQHRAESDISDLRLCMRAMEAHDNDWRLFLDANWALHERIAQITANQLARGIYIGTIRCVAELTVQPAPDMTQDTDGYLAGRVAIHQQLVDAIVSGDPALARAAVAAHRGIAIGAEAARKVS